MRQLIDHEDTHHFFYIPDGDCFTEREVVNRFGDTKRIDRLIVKEKQVWIIDYKSARHSEAEHRRQLAEYITIVGEIYPHREVKGFLVYLDTIKVVEI